MNNLKKHAKIIILWILFIATISMSVYQYINIEPPVPTELQRLTQEDIELTNKLYTAYDYQKAVKIKKDILENEYNKTADTIIKLEAERNLLQEKKKLYIIKD